MYEIVCELCVIFKLKIVYYALLGSLKLNMTQKIYSKYVHNIQTVSYTHLRGLAHHHRLEPALQSRVFFNVLAVLV